MHVFVTTITTKSMITIDIMYAMTANARCVGGVYWKVEFSSNAKEEGQRHESIFDRLS